MNTTKLKDLIYIGIILVTIGMSWGMFSQRLNAVEEKADKIEQIQADIAVIKEKLSNMEKVLLKDYQ
jgi:hypothetical protein